MRCEGRAPSTSKARQGRAPRKLWGIARARSERRPQPSCGPDSPEEVSSCAVSAAHLRIQKTEKNIERRTRKQVDADERHGIDQRAAREVPLCIRIRKAQPHPRICERISRHGAVFLGSFEREPPPGLHAERLVWVGKQSGKPTALTNSSYGTRSATYVSGCRMPGAKVTTAPAMTAAP